MLMLILILIAAGCATAVLRWRWGIFAAIAVGLLQDPLRKMVPGVPGYLSMCSVPVWITTFVMALYSGEVTVRGFLSGFPRLSRWVSIFGLYLLVPAALSFSYGRGSWQITLLGAVVYTAAFLLLAVGFRFPTSSVSVTRVLGFYAIFAGVMMIGGPIDYFGLTQGVAAIGTEAMGKIWVTYRMGSEGIYMYAGFFRSPDVMGWHAALVVMISGILAVSSRGWIRVFWIGLAMWGFMNLWICGRRKMIAMLPVFGGVLLLATFKFRQARRALSLAAVLLFAVALGWYGVTRTYRSAEVDMFYSSTLTDLDDRMMQHGVGAVVGTVRQAGFWGYGLGMGQQGIHHINAEKPRVWQEGGLGKIFAELGVPGAVLFLFTGWVLLATAFCILRLCSESPTFYEYAGLFSILAANLASALVSSQIFGDLFILQFLAFMTGMILSGARNGLVSGEAVCSE